MLFLRKTIHQLFEEQAKKNPNNIALDFKGQKITYRELNGLANCLAKKLVSQGLKKGDYVGVMLNRSMFFIVADLAVLKAGGISQPINIDYPQERIDFMLADTKAGIIITSAQLREQVEQKLGKKKGHLVLELDKKEPNEKQIDKSDLNRKIKPDDLAYILYTSGSTGRPKGVMLYHQGIVNQLFHRQKMLRINSGSVLCHNGTIGFITTPLQIYSALAFGGKLVLFDEGTINNPELLFKKIDDTRVNVLEISVPLLEAYLEIIDENPKKKYPLKSLKEVFIAASKLGTVTASRFYCRYPKIKLFNAYGQTECSGMTLFSPVPFNKNIQVIVEGKPTLNNKVFVLDKNLKLLPPGVPGELYISGRGLAKGYLNLPEKTKEVFLPHPFIKGERIYRTGDLVKRLVDGNIVYLSRADHQVKIRGNRIEPGEINTQLNKCPEIKSSLVVAKKEKDNQGKETEENYLIAYYVVRKNKKISRDEIKKRLKAILPDYMVPAFFIELEKFPLNVNGKLDLLALPEPDKDQLVSKNKYQPPKTELEKQLAAIWQEVLGVKKIGVNDNFFDLGGNSLKLIKVFSKIEKRLGVAAPVIKMFEYGTIKSFQEFLSGRVDIGVEKIKQRTIFKNRLNEIKRIRQGKK
ncbi:MAG TPA: non-ribosomal peptide synthetase [Candidatus Portnoybacteria bacterium]|nr:non-ribosomal peptide synthetase [Candidatus Portnoybacteria bacterium]